MTYGEVSPSHRERFAPGSIRMAEAVHLDLFHDVERAVAWMPGGGLELRQDDKALTMTAKLPPIPAADRALKEIRTGRTTGLSVEFQAVRESLDNGIRVIEQAILSGIGIVKAPSYTQSQIEARTRSGRTIRARIPSDTDLSCECAGVECSYARYTQDLLEELWDKTWNKFEREAIATYGSYAKPLASASKGTMRGRVTDDGLEVDIDVPTSTAGTEVMAAHEDAGIVARPFLDRTTAEGTIMPREGGGNAMAYRKGELRAIIISSTDKREGWPDPEIIATPDDLAQADAPRKTKRRIWL